MQQFNFYASRSLLPLLAVLLVTSVHGQRSCSLGKFCRIGVDCSDVSRCVETCHHNKTDRFQQGNWSTGNCERSKNGRPKNAVDSHIIFKICNVANSMLIANDAI